MVTEPIAVVRATPLGDSTLSLKKFIEPKPRVELKPLGSATKSVKPTAVPKDEVRAIPVASPTVVCVKPPKLVVSAKPESDII